MSTLGIGLALQGLIYNSTDLQPEDLQWYFEIKRGISEVPNVRGKDTIIPGLAGRFEQNRRNDILPLVLEGFVQADPALTDAEDRRASYRANIQIIRALFHSQNARAVLQATMEDGTVQTIDARPLNILGGIYIASEYRELNIELEGYDDWEVAS